MGGRIGLSSTFPASVRNSHTFLVVRSQVFKLSTNRVVGSTQAREGRGRALVPEFRTSNRRVRFLFFIFW